MHLEPPKPRENLTDAVVASLQTWLLGGGLPPGSRLPSEHDLAGRLGVSRPVLREALSNVARHAAANHGDVELVVDSTEVRLTVTDDGVGIGAIDHESGLRNSRRRAEALGGRLELSRREPHGTAFLWRVPLQRG